MIRIKTKQEIGIIRLGGVILANIIDKIGKEIRPGVSTADLDRLAQDLIAIAGGRPSFFRLKMAPGLFFPSAICASIDNEVVHAPAVPGRILKNGQIIKIDIGMEYPLDGSLAGAPRNKHSTQGGYYTDMAKTFIVGDAPKKTKDLVRVTEECLQLGIAQALPGKNLNDIGRAIQRHAESQGFSVVRDMVGHGVGHSLHEAPQVPHYEVKDGSMKIEKLKPGMVIAIEPMINQGGYKIKPGDDDLTWVTADGSLSAQFEHTVAVTEEGNEVLTLR